MALDPSAMLLISLMISILFLSLANPLTMLSAQCSACRRRSASRFLSWNIDPLSIRINQLQQRTILCTRQLAGIQTIRLRIITVPTRLSFMNFPTIQTYQFPVIIITYIRVPYHLLTVLISRESMMFHKCWTISCTSFLHSPFNISTSSLLKQKQKKQKKKLTASQYPWMHRVLSSRRCRGSLGRSYGRHTLVDVFRQHR